MLKNEERKLEEQKGRKLEQSARGPTPRRGDSRLGVQSNNPGVAHPRLGMATNALGQLEEQKGRKLEQSVRAPTPRRGDSRLGVQSNNPGVAHPRLGVATNA
ncbi:hypothetical protein PIB30_084712 [Stylosanthes scabra]|uniref:Uncharacterized protein n=1 Tax=Stylosanthes scabra TaxID=79078 RepID=A0ABU6WSH6_9FABA|nr:hypothetical protein [Stylosanthes scabra]